MPQENAFVVGQTVYLVQQNSDSADQSWEIGDVAIINSVSDSGTWVNVVRVRDRYRNGYPACNFSSSFIIPVSLPEPPKTIYDADE
jgi:hypothetical protein